MGFLEWIRSLLPISTPTPAAISIETPLIPHKEPYFNIIEKKRPNVNTNYVTIYVNLHGAPYSPDLVCALLGRQLTPWVKSVLYSNKLKDACPQEYMHIHFIDKDGDSVIYIKNTSARFGSPTLCIIIPS